MSTKTYNGFIFKMKKRKVSQEYKEEYNKIFKSLKLANSFKQDDLTRDKILMYQKENN